MLAQGCQALQEAVSGLEPWPSLLAGEDGELLAEGEVLKQKVVPRPHSVTQDGTEEEKGGGQSRPGNTISPPPARQESVGRTPNVAA